MSENKIILIIGNQARMQRLMSRLLIDPDACEIYAANDATGGLRAAIEHEVDLVFVEDGVPEIDTLEAVNSIRNYKRDLPMIVAATSDEGGLERSIVLAGGETIRAEQLTVPAPRPPSAPPTAEKSPNSALRDVEKWHIERVLKHRNWNQSAAARVLGIDRKTLRSKIREFHLVHDYETGP